MGLTNDNLLSFQIEGLLHLSTKVLRKRQNSQTANFFYLFYHFFSLGTYWYVKCPLQQLFILGILQTYFSVYQQFLPMWHVPLHSREYGALSWFLSHLHRVDF